jgi:hypothetical protein
VTSTSHSEVESYLLCRRKHFYGYSRRLKRVTESASLAVGSAGHKVLETFYSTVLEQGGDTIEGQQGALEVAYLAALAQFEQLVAEGFRDTDDKRMNLYDILFGWYFPNEPLVTQGWRVLAVEQKFNLLYDEENDLSYPFVVDLIARDPEGKTVVVDHKFVWDFYSYEASELQPQIPKYIGALRALNHKIDYGAYNQLRTRLIKGTKQKDGTYPGPTLDQMLLQLPLKPNSTRVITTFTEQIEAARQLVDVKIRPIEEQDKLAVRVANKMVCQSCSFKDLCISDLNGANSELLIATEYEVRPQRDAFEITEELEEVG